MHFRNRLETLQKYNGNISEILRKCSRNYIEYFRNLSEIILYSIQWKYFKNTLEILNKLANIFQKYYGNYIIICPDTDVGHYQITHDIFTAKEK